MADIKTKERIKGTIRSIDRASIAQDKMKNAYAKTKEMQADETRESKGVEAFASDRAYDTARQVTYASAKATNAAADRSREMASRAKSELKTRSIKRKYIAGKSKPRNDTAKPVRGSAALRKRQMRLAKKRSTEKLVNQNIHGLQKGTRLTARIGKQMLGIAKSVKAIISSTRALIAALAAGGWVGG